LIGFDLGIAGPPEHPWTSDSNQGAKLAGVSHRPPPRISDGFFISTVATGRATA